MVQALLAGSMALPKELVDVHAVRRACTLKYQPMGEPEPLELKAFKEDPAYIYVPRQLGLQICRREGIEYRDQTSQGVKVKFPKVPLPRDYQIDTLDDIQDSMQDFYDFLFRARTGWGKTIGSLIVAARTGVSTLVVVDQENLKDQWIKALVEHFGVAPADIGSIQGKVCKFKGCCVTIAMVQTLSQKPFPQEVYDHFGLVIVDETHVIGAPTFSKVLLEFSAAYRIGVSATPKRRDGLQKVLDYNLGKVRVYVADEHEENSVYVAEHESTYSWYANISPKTGRIIAEITEDASRNLLLAEASGYLYDTGRDVLVLSDRIEQLQHLMDLSYYLGIAPEEMGVYAGYNPVYAWAKDPTPARRPFGWVKHEETKKPEYTPISLQLIAKRMKKPALTAIKEEARVIHATYGMFAKGVDVPRLNGGVDASPRGQSEQVHGRILRKVEGKIRSIWITVVDTNTYRSINQFCSRLPDYLRNNAKVFNWTVEEGPTPCSARILKQEYQEEINHLKSMKIVPKSDGSGHRLVGAAEYVKEQSAMATGTRVRGSVRSEQPRAGSVLELQKNGPTARAKNGTLGRQIPSRETTEGRQVKRPQSPSLGSLGVSRAVPRRVGREPRGRS